MDSKLLSKVLGWSAIFNMAMLVLWSLMFFFGQDLIYSIHVKWFELSRESFNTIHYCGIIFYKLIIFTFFIFPYLALRLVNRF
ncbi:MAG: hypothetical protein GY714_06820 [Desulfobacterales bacterium]|nr:hypothetical protein [Desulfobacterales bacterium]